MTNLAEELIVQQKWHVRSRGKDLATFDQYLQNEFISPEEQHAHAAKRLHAMLQFAVQNVPFYRDRSGLESFGARYENAFGALRTLQVLTKHDVQNHGVALCPQRLPPGEALAAPAKSSGTTGRRTIVQISTRSRAVLVFQKQREYRWFRYDPSGRLAYIRFAHQLVLKPDGTFPKDGEVISIPVWPHIGQYFKTGPHYTFNVTNSQQHQLEFLRSLMPDYLMTYAKTLEHIAFAAGDAQPCDSLKGLVSISEQLTPGMRRKIEGSFAAPVRQNYGLNEIGLVAAECEAANMHVHTEHCWIEIVDDDGHPVVPGGTGRLLVTSLDNFAMPLFRYDTGDLATASNGRCPCGRTLPFFEKIVGRYSRIAFLPDGTLMLVNVLREAVEQMPASAIGGISTFQIHQYRNGGFELRATSNRPLTYGFTDAITRCWNATPGTQGIPLEILKVDSIARSQGGKFQVFTSDFMPPPDPMT